MQVIPRLSLMRVSTCNIKTLGERGRLGARLTSHARAANLYVAADNGQLHGDPEKISGDAGILVSTDLCQVLTCNHSQLGREKLLRRYIAALPISQS